MIALAFAIPLLVGLFVWQNFNIVMADPLIIVLLGVPTVLSFLSMSTWYLIEIDNADYRRNFMHYE
jgi:hypothetical protein